jgi:hypothetical protein
MRLMSLPVSEIKWSNATILKGFNPVSLHRIDIIEVTKNKGLWILLF